MNDQPYLRIPRRSFMKNAFLGGLALCARDVLASEAGGEHASFFQTRGVVLTPEDFSWTDWPMAIHKANLTTLGLHHQNSPTQIIRFIQSETGQKVLEQCKQFGLNVEYELHAMKELLPRDLFEKNPEMFRMDEKGTRLADANLCVSSETALGIVAENAVKFAEILHPTTHRYFYWGDDGQPMCRCRGCRGWSDSEQSLVLENAMLKALRKIDPQAQLAHLAYFNSLTPPQQIKPEPGIFLEYAPINRRYDQSLEARDDSKQKEHLDALEANLEFFGTENAQALEYWLDVSLFSRWTRPAVRLPFDPQVLKADLETYRKRGIRHITTFAVYIDAEYISKYGIPPVQEYGEALR